MTPDNKRRVVVTGGGKGIGRAVAERFAAAGHSVVVMGRDLPSLEATVDVLGNRAQAVTCDVTNPAAVTQAFAEAGPVDVLVNNAGAAASAPAHRIDLDQWEALMTVNATGPFLCTKEVLPAMRQRGWGRIITVASVASHVGAPYIAAYAASKHAALGFTRSVAAEVAGTAITANSVCPGYVRSEMTDRTIANIVASTGRSPDEALASLVGETALGRLVEPDEVAAAVMYLAGEDAGAVNGQSIIIDGGDLQQ